MKNILLLALFLISTLAYSQETTTFILLRHAEKAMDNTQNPPLHPKGEDRAEVLSVLFEQANITAIYSTDFKRTRMTVLSLAKAKGLEIQTYDWKDPNNLLINMLEENAGGTIIISGHSNTTPILANILLGKEQLSQFAEDDYGNLLIITTTKVGTGKMLHLRY